MSFADFWRRNIPTEGTEGEGPKGGRDAGKEQGGHMTGAEPANGGGGAGN